MTVRAVRILGEAELILAEDTRTTGVLLKHFDIRTPMQAYHLVNEHKRAEPLAELIAQGKTVALVSDAGTPCISDPGFLLVRACVERGVEVECLPGSTALIPALAVSGLPCERFCFEGFLPPQKGRQTKLAALRDERRTIVFYESPHRLIKLLEQLATAMGNERRASVTRELSKLHEETRRGTLAELLEYFREKPPRGECVVVVQGNTGVDIGFRV
jgi:16S rRNA (cytidine1402-2'-O)-methyltransferase